MHQCSRNLMVESVGVHNWWHVASSFNHLFNESYASFGIVSTDIFCLNIHPSNSVESRGTNFCTSQYACFYLTMKPFFPPCVPQSFNNDANAAKHGPLSRISFLSPYCHLLLLLTYLLPVLGSITYFILLF